MALPYEDPNDPDYQLLLEQQRATETPQQIQAEVNQPGTPGAQQDQYAPATPPSYYDVNAGANFGGGNNGAPNPNQLYSGLQRGEDGTLQGVGPGMDYDRQAILQRAMNAGQLPAGSDQGQWLNQQPPQQQPSMDLRGMLAKVQLRPDEERALTAAQAGFAKTMNDPSVTGHAKQQAINAYHAFTAPMEARRMRAAALQSQIALDDRFHEHAFGTAANIKSAQAFAQSAPDMIVERKLSDGTLMIGTPHPDGKWTWHHSAQKAEKPAAAEKPLDEKTIATQMAVRAKHDLINEGYLPHNVKADGTPDHAADAKFKNLEAKRTAEYTKQYVGDRAPVTELAPGTQPATGTPPAAGPAAQQQGQPDPPFKVASPQTPRQQQFSDDFGRMANMAQSLPSEKKVEVESQLVRMAHIVEKYGGAHQVTDPKDRLAMEDAARKIAAILPSKVPSTDRGPTTAPSNYPSWHPGSVGAPVGR